MRFRIPAIAFVGLLAPLTAMCVVSACGSQTDDTLKDAATDVTTQKDVTADVAPDVAPEAGCDAPDLLQYLPSGDAGLDVDAGGFAIGPCVDCFKTQCGGQITSCNGDCLCRQGVIDTVTCVAQTGDFTTCGEQAILSGNTNLTALFGCAYSKCQAACIGGDGGLPADAAPKDAAGDGG